MKSFLFYILTSTIFSASAFSQRLSKSMPADPVPESSKEIFDFIFKLDSLDYSSGKIAFEKSKQYNHSLGKSKKVKIKARAKLEALSDTTYSVQIKSLKYLLNTKNGWVINSKNGNSVYRNQWFRIRESQKTNITGTDTFGNFIAHFGNFNHDIPSDIEYEPTSISPDRTIQYKIRRTPFYDGLKDSSWVEDDTIRITKQYNNGKLIFERTARMTPLFRPQIVEINYSYSGDTIIEKVTHFEDGYSDETYSDVYTITDPKSVKKSLYWTGDHTTHSYKYYESSDYRSSDITDLLWKTGKDSFVLLEKYHDSFYSYPFGYSQSALEKTHIYFSGKNKP